MPFQQSFFIDPQAVLNDANRLHESSQKLWTQHQLILSIKDDLSSSWRGSTSFNLVKLSLDITARKIEQEANESEKLAIALENITNEYMKAESNILSGIQKTSGSYTSSSGSSNSSNSDESENSSSDVFSKPPYYGGDQTYGKKLATLDEKDPAFQEAYQVLLQYDPTISPEDAKKFFQSMNDKGCGYVALSNSIFEEFAGREDEFEKIFGFPYRDEKTGQINHDRLLLDIYATTYRDKINLGDNGFPQGTTPDTRTQIIQNYLKDKGIKANVEQNLKMPLSKEDYEKYANSGKHLIIGVHKDESPYGGEVPELMYTPQGRKKEVRSHAMYITGVTDDGKLIVSSWGKEYYIDQSAMDSNETYMIIDYEYEEGNNASSSGTNNTGNPANDYVRWRM